MQQYNYTNESIALITLKENNFTNESDNDNFIKVSPKKLTVLAETTNVTTEQDSRV